MPQDNSFELVFDKFYVGFAPAAHLNSLTEMGAAGSASSMIDCDILDPTYLTQGPELAILTNASEAGSLTEQINFILDVPPEDGITYGIGDTKLYQITPTTLIDNLLGEELITNGEFTGNADGWVLGSDWSYTENHIIVTSVNIPNNVATSTNFEVVESHTYRVSFTVTGSGTVQWAHDGLLNAEDQITDIAEGDYTQDVFADHSDTNGFEIRAEEGFSGNMDNVSIKEVGSFPHTITNCTKGESVIGFHSGG